MRKAQKMQAERFMEVLGRAHRELKQCIEHKKYAAACEIISECQQGAIALGNMIEQSGGEGLQVISLLETYCEWMYQVYQHVESGKRVDTEKIYEALHNCTVQIEDYIKKEAEVRLEIVFLPYKASMWDSLESVWKAADEDPACDAYVVPIPYFDKKPDGSFGEMHYEIDQYPAYVPVMRYEEYDFFSRQPDMVFIHNPYDAYNYVTSVPPFFYSENLKKYTGQLIYIPYFVLGEIDPDDKKAVEEMQHFCTVPAVVHADKVVVQSEAMRRVYIDIMVKTMGKATRKHWEDKILGLGSPKMDKVLSAQGIDFEMPKKWMDMIYRLDGKRKKVILYNTSVSALLKYEEQMLEKMKRVFLAFKEKQEEVVLLWRPHPLMQATIASMRPQLWENYKKLAEIFLKENWGIYDDSSELDRALAVSDGYYGDASSLVSLCRKMGKPAMIQDVEAEYKL